MVAPPRATGQWWQGGDNLGEYIQTFLAEVLCVLYCVVVVFMAIVLDPGLNKSHIHELYFAF